MALRCIKEWPPGGREPGQEKFPEGELLNYADGRMSTEERREKERLCEINYKQIREAADAHRETRKIVQNWIQPGMNTLEIVQKVEATYRALIEADGLTRGSAFPTGVSLNNCAAHYTPNYNEKSVVLKHDDIMKLDFGIHVGGRLVDCAFSVTFDDKWDNLIQATIDGTNVGIKAAGIDVRFKDVGSAIQEAISSYEVELNGRTLPVKPISNLNGHTVDLYQVHGGKSLPIVATNSTERMEEGEVYAIETFASTGRGKIAEEGVCSHYMADYEMWTSGRTPKTQEAEDLKKFINKNFGTLAFCRRWLEDAGQKRYLLSLKKLIDEGFINAYPPLCDVATSMTSQMEHTVILRPTCKEVVTRGPDY